MCKECEIKGIRMALNPLDLRKARETIVLPRPWDSLEARGFHDDLVGRSYAHLAWMQRSLDERQIGNARAFLAAMGKGFQEPFDRKAFEPERNDPHLDLKTHALDAISELSLEFGDRVSSVMWDALAHLGTRSDPEEKASILREAATLPHHYGIVDTMLHAMGKVYTFSLRVQSVFFAHTGMALVHNCDCKCSLLNLKKVDGEIRFDLLPGERAEATQSLFTHMLAESHLILDEKLPFEYSITKDAELLFGIQS